MSSAYTSGDASLDASTGWDTSPARRRARTSRPHCAELAAKPCTQTRGVPPPPRQRRYLIKCPFHRQYAIRSAASAGAVPAIPASRNTHSSSVPPSTMQSTVATAAAAAAAAPPPPATTRASACAAVTSLVASSLCHSYHSTTSISAVESVIPQGGLANGQGKPPPAADADASTRRGERAPRAREQRKPMHATSRNAPREANPLPPSIHSAAAAYRLRVRTRSVPTAPDRSVGEGGEAAGAGAAAA
eukprot:scaffold7921_cov109-Isochrysis_galbana.AAC.5